jgi:hypothetical protein
MLPQFSSQELAMIVTAQAKLGLVVAVGDDVQQCAQRQREGVPFTAEKAAGGQEIKEEEVEVDGGGAMSGVLPAGWGREVCAAVAGCAQHFSTKDLHAVLLALSRMRALSLDGGRCGSGAPAGDGEGGGGVPVVAASVRVPPLQRRVTQGSSTAAVMEEVYGLASLDLLAPLWIAERRAAAASRAVVARPG